MNIINTIVGHGDTILVALIAVVLGWDRFRSGTSNLRKEIAEDYKERNSQLEEKIQANMDEIQKTNIEVARLTGIIQEKDKHIESLTKILQGRNPEMMDILKELKDGNFEIQKFIMTSYDLLKKSSEELGYQTEILENSKLRDEKIDKASSKHVGDPIRVPRNIKRKVI